MNNQTITTEEFIRHYWDVAVFQEGLNKLKEDPNNFILQMKTDNCSVYRIPIEIVKNQIENYLNLQIYNCKQVINKFSEQSPEIYNQITNNNAKGINKVLL